MKVAKRSVKKEGGKNVKRSVRCELRKIRSENVAMSNEKSRKRSSMAESPKVPDKNRKGKWEKRSLIGS